MGVPKLSVELAQEVLDAYYRHQKNKAKAAASLNLSRSTFCGRLIQAFNLNLISKFKSPSPEITLTEARIIKLEREISDLKDRNRELSENHYNIEKIKEIIHNCSSPPIPPKWLEQKTSGTNTGVPTLFCSDWHWDEVVQPLEVNNVNAFNRSIAENRSKFLFTKTVDLLINHMSKPKYEYLVVNIGGDMVSGNIHEELRETNEVPVSKSIISVLDVLIGGLDYLLKYFSKIQINAVPGNHGRWDKKPRFKQHVFENYEWLLYQFLMRHYKNDDRLYFNISDGADLLYKIYDTRYLLTHGDQFKGGAGIAGALSPLMLGDARKRKRSMATDQIYDYMLMGHWHQMFFFKGIIVNGSLKGYDEYAFQNNWDFELPTQALWITHPIWGITARWPVYLEKPHTKY